MRVPLPLRALPLLVAACVVLSACAPVGGRDVPDPPAAPELSAATAPVEYAGSRVDIRPGTRVGDYRYAMLSCYPFDSHVVWGRSPLRDAPESWGERVREVLHEAGVTLTRDPDALFRTEKRNARYLLGARVTGIEMTVCDGIDWFSGDATGRQRGRAEITVDWRVYSVLKERTVFSRTVEAEAKLADAARNGEVLLLDRAMANAARTLLGTDGVRKLLTAPDDASGGEPRRAKLEVASPPLYTEPLRGKADRVRHAVVTVGADGHGSGVFVTPALILTNQHVVGANDRMPVTLTDGRRVMARVLRRDRRRDVAVLHVEPDGHTPVPIRADSPRIADTVYAVGTPLDEDLAATVTRGTVSAFRESERGLRLIQADADIQGGNSGGPLLDARGNVVGLAVSGVQAGGDPTSIGVNFFIPIAAALDHLDLALRRDADAPRAGVR
ncbi:Trypsin-like peptidase domain-containing protein [Limimonas halophila]|uniref:Trypsin-like peptidase domain-containing protein n=1 Tax=Limimonas halophila TaxID=1082479 RepID=A0A1G7RCC7_9PROT|nr:trypsin-like peptidase domain-containing protein [Limimonas halophila]SDG08392.1 Trypsin-like peptidase domain-containing protein [Limimonas halophila]